MDANDIGTCQPELTTKMVLVGAMMFRSQNTLSKPTDISIQSLNV